MDQEISTNPFADDKLHEECGIFGIWGKPDAAAFVALGLHALQHRGQEAAGIVTCHDGKFYMERREGLVGDQFSVGGPIDKLRGPTGIGHVRYSTTGGSLNRNIQPFFADVANGGIAIAHNGNLTNAYALRQRLVRNGSIFYSTSDTECIVHLVATSRAGPIVDAVSAYGAHAASASAIPRPPSSARRRRSCSGSRSDPGIRSAAFQPTAKTRTTPSTAGNPAA
jgi:amidophosphoribosyltransferase